MPVDVDVEVEELATHTLVRVRGELEFATAPELQRALAGVSADRGPVLCDLSDVTFLDSSALRVLVQARLRLGTRESLRLVVPRPSIRRVFEISGLSEEFELFDGLGEASHGL